MTALQREETTAAGGARWVTVSFVLTGLLNYAYALLMTRLLGVGDYSVLAAGQGLLMWAVTVATVSIPWVLAQAVARARSAAEHASAARFGMIISSGTGLAGGAVVGGISSQFAGPWAALALALSTFIIFLGTTTSGWMQGRERMRPLSILYVAENLLKNGSGVLLVLVAGLGDAGALAAFGIGGLLLLVWWPRVPRGGGRPWRAALANRDLWRRAVGIAEVQGLVALLLAIDVVMVAVLPVSRAAAASYQASVALSRVPLFLATAVATAFFPSMSRRYSDPVLTARATRMYAMVALPLTVILVTMPGPVLGVMFPAQYGQIAELLRYTAIGGLAIGGVSLAAAFFQAADDYSCRWWLAGGVLGFTVAAWVGWLAGGITGLAAGVAAGSWLAAGLTGYRLVRQQGAGVLGRIPLLTPAVAAVPLALLRPYPAAWLGVAIGVGLLASLRFLHVRRPGQAPPGLPEPGRPGQAGPAANQRGDVMRISRDEPAAALLTGTLWRGQPRGTGDADLYRALALARRNHVEGRLARAYPDRLPAVLAEVRVSAELFVRNLEQVTGRLRQAGIPAVLIKADSLGDCVHNDIDIVVPGEQWAATVGVLKGWYVHTSQYWLEHAGKALFFPLTGPALHLHAAVSWFGIPVVPAGQLLDSATANEHGCLSPAPPEELRILLAHALFQELALPLSALLAVRGLLEPETVAIARDRSRAEGWHTAFDGGLAVAHAAMGRLDRGEPLTLPVPVPVSLALRTGYEHATHLGGHGRARAATREAALRVPLIIAKRRRMLTG